MLFKVEEKVKEAAEISMGTEISEEDISNINHLCQQVVEIQVSFFFKTNCLQSLFNDEK